MEVRVYTADAVEKDYYVDEDATRIGMPDTHAELEVGYVDDTDRWHTILLSLDVKVVMSSLYTHKIYVVIPQALLSAQPDRKCIALVQPFVKDAVAVTPIWAGNECKLVEHETTYHYIGFDPQADVYERDRAGRDS